MNQNLVAKAVVTINGKIADVWGALIDPAALKQYMFGSDIHSDWKPGSPITFKGEWQGRRYEDKGEVLEVKPREKLKYTHFSPLAGLPDKPENYHTITVELAGAGEQTRVTLSQDNNTTEEAREHSQKNWEMVLNGLKKYVENRSK